MRFGKGTGKSYTAADDAKDAKEEKDKEAN